MRILMLFILLMLGFDSQAQDEKFSDTSQPVFIYWIVEQRPQFGNGEPDLLKYIAENLSIPDSLKDSIPAGRIVVQFVIDTSGDLVQLEVIRSLHPIVDRDVLMVLDKMPLWTPGKHQGRLVNVLHSLPINIPSARNCQSLRDPLTPEE